MVVIETLVCIGLITCAALCGVFLGWLEQKAEEEDAKRDFR